MDNGVEVYITDVVACLDDVDVDDDVDLIATIMLPAVREALLIYHTKKYTFYD